MNRPILFDIPQTETFAEADEILKSRDFVQGEALEVGRVPHLPEIITSIDGPRHMARRRLYMPLFRPKRLAMLEADILRRELREALDEAVKGQAAPARVPDLPWVIRSAIVKVSAALIGLDLADEDAVRGLVEHARNIAEGRDQVWAREPNPDSIARGRETWVAFIRDYFEPSAERRRALVAAHAAGRLGADELPNDLITLMLTQPDHDEAYAPIMAYEVGLFLTASVNTTAAVAPKAVEACAHWLEAHPEDQARREDLDFLRLVAQEALRLYPTVPFLVREAARDVTLSTGRSFKAGDLVRTDITGGNRDRSAFGEDADVFNPHRTFSAPRHFGLSFGGGPHFCIGREMTIGRTKPGPADGAVGLTIAVLQEVYARGLTLDPDDLPQLVGGTSQHKYLSFPVLLHRPEGLCQ
ncbi:cytochrome P450 [Acuticoccus mangrovi]|uniref:Cytochrome P450 n=1 Tax=Acuticoccus mangrovi TaxID=2796142 RepID=A0A934IQT9_9HYPH|nr:cytochrome P450 [Acuticoccus mangrovi]MBJ3777021.1 cytochrome P450 [Acuticoccus mangrovi]